MGTPQSLIAELEDAIRDGSPDKRVETLRRATDLFLSQAERLTKSQIAVFDDVLVHLIKKIETRARAELSARLAPVNKAPIEVIRRLARDDEITVAEPVLTRSTRLTNNDLIDVAKEKSQRHLLAIAGRSKLEKAVTDVLMGRGDREVKYKLASNAGARFSETGFTSLVKSAEDDESLTERIGLRIDLPLRLLRRLLSKATAAVRARLLANAPAETRDAIQQILSKISSEVYREIAAPRDFSQALETINAMQKQGTLNEATLLAFANARSYEETVAALGALCSNVGRIDRAPDNKHRRIAGGLQSREIELAYRASASRRLDFAPRNYRVRVIESEGRLSQTLRGQCPENIGILEGSHWNGMSVLPACGRGSGRKLPGQRACLSWVILVDFATAAACPVSG